MRCAVIIGPSLKDVREQIKKASEADLLEWRLDLFQECSIDDLRKLRKSLSCPVIFTGGGWEHKALDPDYSDSPQGDIISYHNFEEMPDLRDTLEKMRQVPARYYKMACHAKTILDALRMALFAKTHENVLGIAMGEHGTLTRMLAKPWTYVAIDEDHIVAPGQLTLQDPAPQKNVYGLIGGAVENSPSFSSHNKFMQALGLEACYVKMAVQKEELSDFLALAKQIGIKGLSVTMPLKEAVIPYLDHIDEKAQEIGAVNTIVFEDGKLFGFNTDAEAALDALELKGSVAHKKLVILGAGGAAKAIAYEANFRKADVTLVRRGEALPPYDILINATPVSLDVPFRPGSVVMDIRSYPIMTPFLEAAQKKGCRLVFGYEMFVRQALKQFKLWKLIN